MTPDERQLISSLVVVPGRPRVDHRAEVLRGFGADNGSVLGKMLLDDAAARRDALDVELALVVAHSFGLTIDYLDLLISLSYEDWHRKHEDIAKALGRLGNASAVPALYSLAQRIPEYLEYDDARTLARTAIWALGKIPGDEARESLLRLSEASDQTVGSEARSQLRRRGEAMP